MNKVFIKNGKAIVYDDRWVTIGGEDEDGSGQHVLIKENGTIVAGFGTGKNVKNAFSETNKESGAKPEANPEEPKEKKSLATPEALLKSNKNYKAWAESEVERLRKERDQKYRDAYTEEEGVKIVEKYDKEINELKESLKRTDENIRKHTKAVEEKTSTLKEEPTASKKDYEKRRDLLRWKEAKQKNDSTSHDNEDRKWVTNTTEKFARLSFYKKHGVYPEDYEKGATKAEEPKSTRSASSERAFNKAKESVKNASFGTNPQAFADAESEAKEQLKKWKSIAQKDPTDALAKRKVAWAEGLVEGYKERRDKGQAPKDWAEIEAERKRERENALKEAKPFTKKYKFNSPEEEEANRKAKAEIFRQANEESKRKQAEKDRKDKIEARKALKRAEAGLAEAKAKGDGKSQSFWEATRDRAENTLGKSSDPERQIKLLERERDRKYDEAETEKEKTKVFNAYKRKIDAIRSLGRKSASDSKIVVIADGKVKIGE